MPLAVEPDGALARVRAAALALPETGEKVSHGIPAFHVAGKMFAYFRHDHHGDGQTVLCVKTGGRDEQDLLIEQAPELYSWPAYIGPSGWIAMAIGADDTDWTHVENRIARSWELAAPRRLLEAGGR
ncbi:MmcQ/YjbR family DNA-binding protein [Sphingomonas baiyangensis]|uniref:MmcQ/YjbR family DNA-binding protein n=1 Tax=Sphingomonas baiyangensis TaxID=2572576 RepID=A0A4U1L2R6_9SPHN|nr:MmcQ/YjbR family DNA-binding protein [Sphingomonas baiyangensis]TKD51181.1 MmcQ/YjbR family DNA-binding protein [Sphingomonas baiyangensis]